MTTIDRRSFLATLAAAAGAAQFGLTGSALAADGPVGFPEASSNPLRWPFVMGLLVVTDPAAREAEVAALRDKTSYRRKLAYASSDRKKEAFAEALIAWFAASRDVSFAGLVVNDPTSKWPDGSDARDAVLTTLCKQLIGIAGNPAGLAIQIPAKRKAPRDRIMRAVVPPSPATGDFPHLDETARFLTGNVYGDVTHAAQPLRAKLVTSLGSALKVPALADAKVAGKFSVAPVALS